MKIRQIIFDSHVKKIDKSAKAHPIAEKINQRVYLVIRERERERDR
jgi:hypothetical protein